MRHQKKKKLSSKKTAARRSILANLVESLVLFEKITTTKPKARALRPVVEKLITKAKKGNLTARRELMKVMYTDNAIKKMLEVVAPRYKDRDGGYTRIITTQKRLGDGAEKAIIELVK